MTTDRLETLDHLMLRSMEIYTLTSPRRWYWSSKMEPLGEFWTRFCKYHNPLALLVFLVSVVGLSNPTLLPTCRCIHQNQARFHFWVVAQALRRTGAQHIPHNWRFHSLAQLSQVWVPQVQRKFSCFPGSLVRFFHPSVGSPVASHRTWTSDFDADVKAQTVHRKDLALKFKQLVGGFTQPPTPRPPVFFWPSWSLSAAMTEFVRATQLLMTLPDLSIKATSTRADLAWATRHQLSKRTVAPSMSRLFLPSPLHLISLESDPPSKWTQFLSSALEAPKPHRATRAKWNSPHAKTTWGKRVKHWCRCHDDGSGITHHTQCLLSRPHRGNKTRTRKRTYLTPT